VTGTTDPDFLPYSVQSDYGDVQQWFDLAMRVDAIAQAADQAFNEQYRPRAFLFTGSGAVVLGTGNPASSLSSYWNTTTVNTSNGMLSSGSWKQDPAEQPSWWMLGCSLTLTNTSGTASTSTHTGLYFTATSTDPVTGQFAAQNYGPSKNEGRYSGFRLNLETNSGGEGMSIATVMPLYQGQVSTFVQIWTPAAGDTASRSVAANGAFWGIRLGRIYT